MKKSGLGYSSLKKVRSLISMVEKYALETEVITKAYAPLLRIGKHHYVRPHKTFSRQKINRLWSMTDQPGVDTVLILLYTGMRVGEMLALQKSDISLRQQLIRITRSKTQAGIRTIPIHHRILPLITARMDGPGAYLITDPAGKPYSYARYCNRLSAAWQRLVVERGSWPVDWEDAAQRRFFENRVSPKLALGRVAVVVSDALRYEAGADWSRRVADRGRCQVQCTAMLASLPTYTQLGMASLLPNQTLSIDPKTLTATVDGADATGAQHREQILRREEPGTVVLSYEELFDQEGAERLGGAKLAYVYHNVIDMTGDKRDSEERTFAAVDETFDQLDRACGRLFQLGFSCVFVVADHGFLYQRESKSFDFAEVPFLGVAVGTDNAKQSRRFVVANDLPACDALIELGAPDLGLAGDFTCGFPKGTRRMRLSGSGARFVHGGMTLQEAVVPCVRLKRAKAGGSATPVGVDLLTGGTKVITGSFVRFEIFQTNPVGDGVLPVSLQVGLYDAQGQLRSETKPIEVASSSPNAEERRIPVMLTVAQDVANGARLTLRVDQRYGTTSKYKTVAQADYVVRRNFGLDF